MSKSIPENRDARRDPASKADSSPDEAYAATLPIEATLPGSPVGETVAISSIDESRSGTDGTNFPATLQTPSGVLNTLEQVRGQVQRKAAAVLRTTVGDYEIERELGRGGMGVVYKARHRQLKRDVALKMILSGRHAGPEQLERFLAEARAVAQLQHPNIVQIFDIGEHDGLPYFSLEYVDGACLAHQLKKEPQTSEHAGSTLELLARAMQYAHDHGVLHRDLKPANVLMTKEGVPKITDFGLAKKVDDDEAASTRTGTVMGTPSYMSPEQALGLTHEVGPAADQYSLAAMLYEMLTGRPPFIAPKAVDTILQVIHEEPIRPRQLQPSIPVDLETICLKGLQKEPGKRYASCFELAEDLRRFREGAPILARPVGSLERTWRWCRRNPRVASLAAMVLALLIFVAVGSSAAAFKISREQAETERQRAAAVAARHLADEKAAAEVLAREAAEKARKDADENAKVASDQAGLALTTLQTLIDKVQKQLENVPGNQQLKKDLLQTAMDGLDRVAERAEKSGATGATMAAAHMKLGLIYKQLGESENAWKQFMRCHEITQARLAEKPDNDARKSNVAATLTVLAEMSQDLRRDMKAALEYYREALAIREDLYRSPHAGDEALDPTLVKQGLAEAYTRVGTTIFRLGNPTEATEYFLKALKLRQEMAEAAPENSAIQQDLARSYLALAEMYYRFNKHAEARAYYDKSLQLRESFFQKDPQNIKLKQELARLYGMLGERYLHNGEHDAARPMIERGMALSGELAELDPKHADYRRDLGIAYYRCASLAVALNDRAGAADYYQKCREVRERLAQDDPANARRQMELMLVLPHCGEHERAAEIAAKLREPTSVDSEMLVELARCYAQCAVCVQDNAEKSDQYLKSAMEVLTQAVSQGYKDLVFIEGEPDLAPLRARADYQTLMQTLRTDASTNT